MWYEYEVLGTRWQLAGTDSWGQGITTRPPPIKNRRAPLAQYRVLKPHIKCTSVDC